MEVNSDHEGCSSRVRPFHCTQVGLTPTIIPNVDNSNAQFLIVGTACALSPLMKTRNDSFHSTLMIFFPATRGCSSYNNWDVPDTDGNFHRVAFIMPPIKNLKCCHGMSPMRSTQDHEFGSKQVFKCKTYKVRIKTNSINLALGARQ